MSGKHWSMENEKDLLDWVALDFLTRIEGRMEVEQHWRAQQSRPVVRPQPRLCSGVEK